jgi:enoyl-CoA hydratase/carnithine racemase
VDRTLSAVSDEGFSQLRCLIAAPHVALIQLARPEALNALTLDMCQELVVALDFARDTDEVRVVIITGSGPIFSMGDEFRGTVPDLAKEGQPVAPVAAVLAKLDELGKPSIAAINGRAHGAGLALALACDVVIASQEAELAAPEIRFGLWPMHLTRYLVETIGARRAFEMMATGLPIRGAVAELGGLINRAVGPGELQAEVTTLATKLAAWSPSALRYGTRAVRRMAAARAEAERAELQALLEELMATEDAREGIRAFNEQRAPQWKGK